MSVLTKYKIGKEFEDVICKNMGMKETENVIFALGIIINYFLKNRKEQIKEIIIGNYKVTFEKTE